MFFYCPKTYNWIDLWPLRIMSLHIVSTNQQQSPKWVQLYRNLSDSCCYITVLKVQNLVEDRFIKWNFTAKNLLLTFSTCFSIPLFYHFLAFRSQTLFSINVDHKQLAILHHQDLILQLIQFWEIPNKSIRCHILYSILEIDPKVK